jgi:hypothetical protein
MRNSLKKFYFWLILALISCGRHDTAYIINKSNDTLLITLYLNKKDNVKRPDDFFLQEIVSKEKSQTKDYKLAGDCLISYDSIQNKGIFRFYPRDKIKLPSIRMGGPSRNDYQCWEFNKIQIQGNAVEIMASDRGIMTFVHKKSPWFAADYYNLEIETNKK